MRRAGNREQDSGREVEREEPRRRAAWATIYVVTRKLRLFFDTPGLPGREEAGEEARSEPLWVGMREDRAGCCKGARAVADGAEGVHRACL